VVLGKTGRNFAAGMSGGVAYVYDPDAAFSALCNMSMCDLERVEATALADDPRRPRQKALGSHDAGMGDMLRFDAERLRILVERHLLYTGSARAREILDNWDVAVTRFIKVMPKDYRSALAQMETERQTAATVAAE
jgi:glutamate synthase (NADPH/NADH) large chain